MEFRILGPLEVWDGGSELALGGRKPRALLSVLLLHPNEVVPADRLIDELWGEDSTEGAAAALRVNVSRLRRVLPPDVLTTRSPGYVVRIGRDELDLDRFERLVEEGRSLLTHGLAADAARRLRDALSVWRGPALAEFAYESFARGAIVRLDEIRLAALELRIEADLALGRHDELIGELEALVVEHPFRERLRRCLMTALYRSGRQAEALDAYKDARRALVDELGIEPGTALQELERGILRQDPALGVDGPALARGEVAERPNVAIAHETRADKPLAPAEPLVRQSPRVLIFGREDEIDHLRVFVDADAIDGPRAIVLEGEAGIGKSTIWLSGLDLARQRGLRVLSSRPAEAEQDLAYAGLGDLIEGIIDDVLPALPPPRRHALEVALLMEKAQEPLEPRALGVALRTVLELLAAEGPLVVAVDDVQWLDQSSASALAFALRRTRARLHILLARRVDERSEASALEGALSASLERLRVGPLSAGALQAVVRAQLERVFPRPTLLRIHETSGGNPFYALEIARALPHELDPSQPLPIPETLEELVRARIDALPEPSRRALVLLSTLGEGDTATLRSAGVEDGLEAAVAHGIVERTADRLRFTHPLLASSVYQGADKATRRSSHATLSEIARDPLERARHLALSRSEPDSEIAAAVDEAAEIASEQGAMATAIALRRQALRLTPADESDDIHRRSIALVRAQAASGAPASSLEPFASDILLRAANGVPRAEALLLVGEISHDGRAVLALRREAVDAARDDPALQGRIHRELAWEARFVEGLEASERHAHACLEIADRLGDDALRAAGLVVLSTLRFHMAEPDALRLGAEGHALASAVAGPEQLVWDTLTFASTLIWSFHLDEARTLLEPRYLEWSARHEGWAGQMLWRLGCIELLTGRLDAAADFAERALEICEAYESLDVAVMWLVAQVAAWRGDFARARSMVDRVRASEDLTPWFMPHVETVLGQLALWSGDPGTAIEHFSRAEVFRTSGSLEPNLARWRADYAEALVQVDRTADALSLLEAWEAEAVRVERGVVLAQVTRCRGLVAAARGEVAAAATLLERAVAEHAAVGDTLGRARALLALGVLRRRGRQRSAARNAIEEAAAIFDECGARSWAERARSELVGIGGRTRVEGLTPAERRVAALVAQGRTNREVAAALVLGKRTVETHLTHIYAKLGVRSRTELARVYEHTR